MTNHDTGKVDAKKARIIVGDCLEVLKGFESDSIDSLVTDPPAGIGFMGQEWDHHKGGRAEWVAWMTGVMRECHRVMKPGAHGLVWAIPRTSHWTATALEDAGFEVRDICTHLFGQGFPKSLDISKAIDKAAGAERDRYNRAAFGGNFSDDNGSTYGTAISNTPATDAAKQWQGFGTALKPAAEFWVLVRKPISEKNVAANVLKHGVGGINIDGCRVGSDGGTRAVNHTKKADGRLVRWDEGPSGARRSEIESLAMGRFPANLVLSCSPFCSEEQHDIECAIAMLDEQSLAGGMHSAGKASSGKKMLCRDMSIQEGPMRERLNTVRLGDSGGASRFFYCAKISSGERNAGLEGMPAITTDDGRAKSIDNPFLLGETARKNHHPTVKPQKLMRYLCKLVTPPGGLVLDPFMGSGSTGLAALSEGFRFIGIEREPEYFEIAEKRIFNHFPEAKKEVQT